jgi:hypothetical protein
MFFLLLYRLHNLQDLRTKAVVVCPETGFVNVVFVARWMIRNWFLGVNSTVLVDVLISIFYGG